MPIYDGYKMYNSSVLNFTHINLLKRNLKMYIILYDI